MEIRTQIRHAFDNIKVQPSAHTEQGQKIAAHVNRALHSKAGIREVRSSNYKLSLRTYTKLKEEGIVE